MKPKYKIRLVLWLENQDNKWTVISWLLLLAGRRGQIDG